MPRTVLDEEDRSMFRNITAKIIMSVQQKALDSHLHWTKICINVVINMSLEQYFGFSLVH